MIKFYFIVNLFCISIVNAQHWNEVACGDSSFGIGIPDSSRILFTSIVEESQTYKNHFSIIDSDKVKLKQAEELYSEKKYDLASLQLIAMYSKYRQDPYFLNQIARTTYWSKVFGKRSLGFYQELISLLDSLGNREASSDTSYFKQQFIINTTFSEAYWKIATLLLDAKRFSEAAKYFHTFELYQNSANLGSAGHPIWEQMYMYMTETYFFLKNKRANKFYYCLTKTINPNNDYVDQFKLE